MTDMNTFEGSRIVNYVQTLERRLNRAEENSNAYKVEQLQKTVTDLEFEISKRDKEINSLRLKVAKLGMDIGKLLLDKKPGESYVEIYGNIDDNWNDPVLTTKPLT